MLKDAYSFNDLVEIMKFLRSGKGCPWDREQSYKDLKKYLIEETYEVLEAIDLEDSGKLSEELGDLLLQIVFLSQIATEEGKFDINTVITGICRKMIQRHTHVFGQDIAKTAQDVVDRWEINKKKEKGIRTQTEVLKDVPSNLPALMRSYKIQQKAAQVGFDWDKIEDVFSKVDEEIRELKSVYASEEKTRIEDELGDVLFSIVNLARFLDVHPELALTGTINKFIKRFEYVEAKSKKQGRELKYMTLAEMDKLWDEAKIIFAQENN
ncbi:MAG TPA: nucleoside triphosphate pyrophosphohydrolase [Clostridiaceae bacterium]|jgi:tetrapyrrole methylase family protein/MazG family protein|nr:nucleoside triphosphate pyrophosphohydrolase [Clostridiaceae bacterium]